MVLLVLRVSAFAKSSSQGGAGAGFHLEVHHHLVKGTDAAKESRAALTLCVSVLCPLDMGAVSQGSLLRSHRLPLDGEKAASCTAASTLTSELGPEGTWAFVPCSALASGQVWNQVQ